MISERFRWILNSLRMHDMTMGELARLLEMPSDALQSILAGQSEAPIGFAESVVVVFSRHRRAGREQDGA